MQPNSYNPQQQYQSNQQNGTYFELANQQGSVQMQQPNTPPQAEQVTQATPQKSSGSKGALIMAILFAIISVGLGAYLIVDKFVLNKDGDSEVAEAITNINTPLSEIDAANYSKALAGRTFVVDETFEQSITFTSDSEYDLNYYVNPSTDIAKYDISTNHGKYTVEKDTITLDKGDSFSIQKDYLIKTSDSLTKNKSTVYFDLQQYPKTTHDINNALQQKLSTWGGNVSTDADKVYFKHLICDTSSKRLTNADAYMCNSEFTLYFGEASTKSAIEKSSYKTFADLCLNDAGYTFYKGTCSATEYAITTQFKLIVRIESSGTYKIIGIFTEQEADSEEDTKDSKDEDDKDGDSDKDDQKDDSKKSE